MFILIREFCFFAMLFAMLFLVSKLFFSKQWKEAFLCLCAPFYLFRYLLKQKKTNANKILSICLMGGFTIFFFLTLLEVLLHPPE